MNKQSQNPLDLTKNQSPVGDDNWAGMTIGCEPGTIRTQRHKRRRGLDHWFTVDPVMIGSLPRYRKSDVLEWLEEQIKKQQNGERLANRSNETS